MSSTNGWSEYKKLVVLELSRNGKKLNDIEVRLNKIERNLSDIRARIYVASSIAAIIFSGIVTLSLRFLVQ